VVEITTIVIGVASQCVLGQAAGGNVKFAMVVDILLAFALSGRVVCQYRPQQGQEA